METEYTFEDLKRDMVFGNNYAFYRYGDLTRDKPHMYGKLTIEDLDLLFKQGWKLVSHCKDNYLNGINEYLFEKHIQIH